MSRERDLRIISAVVRRLARTGETTAECVIDETIVQELGYEPKAVVYRLQQARLLGLVESRKVGKNTLWRVAIRGSDAERKKHESDLFSLIIPVETSG